MGVPHLRLCFYTEHFLRASWTSILESKSIPLICSYLLFDILSKLRINCGFNINQKNLSLDRSPFIFVCLDFRQHTLSMNWIFWYSNLGNIHMTSKRAEVREELIDDCFSDDYCLRFMYSFIFFFISYF